LGNVEEKIEEDLCQKEKKEKQDEPSDGKWNFQ